MKLKKKIRRLLFNLFGIKYSKYKYGFKQEKKDSRDFVAKFGESFSAIDLPESIDLRDSGFIPRIYNQYNCGSCVGNSIAAALEYDRAKQGFDVWTPSRLFIYYYARALEGTIHEDVGCTIRDGYKVINSTGYAKELTWPYDVSKFATEPSETAKNEASLYKSVNYQSVPQTEHDIKSTLASGYCISLGIQLYPSFETPQVASSGIVPMPSMWERKLGGHAILAIGYLKNHGGYICRNSWGESWGQNGYFIIPEDYIHDPKLACDFWVVQSLNQ